MLLSFNANIPIAASLGFRVTMKMLLSFNANRPIAPSVSHTLHSAWTLLALFDVSSKMTNASRHNVIILFSCALQRQKCVCRGHGLISPALFWATLHPNHVLSLVCILAGCVCVCVCVRACDIQRQPDTWRPARRKRYGFAKERNCDCD